MTDIYDKLAQDQETLKVERSAGFVFSSDDLRSVTDWAPQVIEDYLTKTRSISTVGKIEQDIIDAIFDLEVRVEALENQVSWLTPVSIVATNNFTTSGNQFVYCNNARPDEITITLNANPRDAERVWITRGGYNVTISGNGKTINGEAQIGMKRVNETRALEYNAAINQWVIV